METTYMVGGLSCARCLVDLMDGVRGVPGVDSVAVDLVRDGTSSLIVRSRVPLAAETVPDVVRKMGFWLWVDARLDEMEVAR